MNPQELEARGQKLTEPSREHVFAVGDWVVLKDGYDRSRPVRPHQITRVAPNSRITLDNGLRYQREVRYGHTYDYVLYGGDKSRYTPETVYLVPERTTAEYLIAEYNFYYERQREAVRLDREREARETAERAEALKAQFKAIAERDLSAFRMGRHNCAAMRQLMMQVEAIFNDAHHAKY